MRGMRRRISGWLHDVHMITGKKVEVIAHFILIPDSNFYSIPRIRLKVDDDSANTNHLL